MTNYNINGFVHIKNINCCVLKFMFSNNGQTRFIIDRGSLLGWCGVFGIIANIFCVVYAGTISNTLPCYSINI